MNRNPYVYDSDEEEPENTPEELQAIYDNIDSMIDYVAKRYLQERMYKYSDTFTRVYMFDYYKKKLHIILSTPVTRDLEQQLESRIQQRVNLSQDAIRQAKYNNYLNYVRRVFRDKAKNKTKITSDNLFKRIPAPDDPSIRIMPIKNSDKVTLYNEYLERYNSNHPKEPNPVKPVRPTRIKFSDKLDTYVGLHHRDNDLLDYEQFEQLTSNWNDVNRNKTTREYYNEYLEKYYRQSGQIKTDIVPFANTFGYKSKKKYNALLQINPNLKSVNNDIPSSFPLKDNIKKYQVHKVAARNTYMIDLMFSGKLCYLVCINVNTKFLSVELMNEILNEQEQDTIQFSKQSKDVRSYLNALQRIINKGVTIQHLTGDGEKAFDSRSANIFYRNNNIDFKAVPRQPTTLFPEFVNNKFANKSDPLHSALGIIDRVIRTIRDMAYNMKIDPNHITPNIMIEIVNQYNNAPHIGLSQYAGFDVTPSLVQHDRELEDYIVRKICQCNYEVVNTPGYQLRKGDKVKVYNEKDSMSKRREVIQPGEFVVDKVVNGLCHVKNLKNNKIQYVPRYKLTRI